MEEIMALKDFQILVAVTVTIIGGIWGFYIFVAERNHLPKMELSISANCAIYDENQYIVYSKLIMKNVGKIAIKPLIGQVKLQQVAPPFDGKSVDFKKYNYLSPNDDDVLWPLIGERNWEWCGGDTLLEPDESDELDVDFLVLKNLELVRLYGFIGNPVTKNGGWHKNYTFSLKKACITESKGSSSRAIKGDVGRQS